MSYLNNTTSNLTQPTRLPGQNLSLMTFLSVTPCVIFLYINGVMLFTLTKKTVFQEASRYILFGQMLWTETIDLFIGMVMFVSAVTRTLILKIVCLVILVSSRILYQVSTLNLALMSLERYVAICFPLRHAEITSYRRTNMAIAVIWMIGLIQSVADLIIFYSVDSTDTTMTLFCSRTTLLRLQLYKKLETTFTCIYFISVCLVVMFTYVSISIVARSASGDKTSAKKANKTVLLHLMQLGLAAVSILLDVIFEAIYVHVDYITSVNLMYFFFVVFIIFPRCLSPLIYGLRDQAFSCLFKYYFTLGLKKQNTCHTEIH